MDEGMFRSDGLYGCCIEQWVNWEEGHGCARIGSCSLGIATYFNCVSKRRSLPVYPHILNGQRAMSLVEVSSSSAFSPMDLFDSSPCPLHDRSLSILRFVCESRGELKSMLPNVGRSGVHPEVELSQGIAALGK